MKSSLLSFAASILLLTQATPVLADSAVFGDIEASYAKDAILELQRRGMVNGVSDSAFAPESLISRQDFAVLYAKALQLDVSKPPAVATFVDIPTTHYAFPYVEALVQAHVLQGKEPQRFGGSELLTREELAVVLVRGIVLNGSIGEAKAPFEDRNEISDWAAAGVQTVKTLGIMEGDGSHFAPKRNVQRQELALVISRLLHLKGQNSASSGVIESVSEQSIIIDQHNYGISEGVRGILNPQNAAVLEGASLTFEAKDQIITKLTSLDLQKNGQAVQGQEKEFSRNLVLDGHGNQVDGDVNVKADYVSIHNLRVAGNFRIGEELKNDFYGKDLKVKGKTLINGGSPHTIVFENSALEQVQVNKQDVRIEPLGSTTVNEMVLNSNATVTADAGVTVSKLTIADGASQVEINAHVAALQLQASGPATITGSGSIDTVTISGKADVNLQTSGTIGKLEITNKDAKVTLPVGVTIQNIVLPEGAKASELIANYSAVSGQIASISTPSGQSVNSSTSSPSKGSRASVGTVTGYVYYGTANKPMPNATVTLQGMTVNTGVDGSYVFSSAYSGVEQSLSVTADGFTPNPFTTAVNIAAGQTTAVPAIALTSAVNHAPVVIQAIPKQTIGLNSSGMTFNLNDRVQDEDGDVLKFTAVSLSTKVAKVELTGSELKVIPVGTGTANISFTANDGRGKSVNSMFVVTVTAAEVNHDPKLAGKGFADLSATAGGAEMSIDLGTSFIDEDGDALTFQAISSNVSSVTANVYGNWLKLKPLQAGDSTITVKAEDGKGGRAETTFAMKVTGAPIVNHDPQAVKTIPDQTGIEQGSKVDYELAGTFTDADGDALTLSAESSDPSVATVKVTGTKLELTPLTVGTSHITVKAEDGKGGKAETTFAMKVTAAPVVNHDPQAVKTIPDQTGVEQGSKVDYELAGTFTDADGDALTLSAESSDPSVATVKVTGTKLELTPLTAGTSRITVKAEDGKGGKAETTFAMKVSAAPVVNHDPQAVKTIPDQTGVEQGSKVDYELSGTFTDADGDALTLSAESSDPSVATVKVTGTKLELTPLTVGTSRITVKAEDGKGGKAETTFAMKVSAANHNPVLLPVPDQLLSLSASPQELELSSYLQDADGDSMTLYAVSQDPSVVAVSVTGTKLVLTPVSAGQTQINVTVEDSRGGSTAGAIKVKVESPAATNHKPEVVSVISAQVLTSTVTNDRTYDLSQLFDDADGDVLQFSVTTDLPNMVKASVAGSLLTLSAGTQAGTAKVTVTANDGHGGTASYDVTVRNAPLVTDGFITYRTKQGVSDLSYDVSSHFPSQTSFTVYKGTPDSTFIGPTTNNGKVIFLTNDSLYTWVIGADGKAIVIRTIVDPQGAPEMFFSEYTDGGDGRIAVEMYYKGDGDPSHKATGYQIEVYQWMKATNSMKVTTRPIMDTFPMMPYIFINTIFYDFFDITNAAYYNDELDLYRGEYNTVALVLKKDGKIVDVLGDPSSHNPFMPTGGTIIRKQGIYTGSKTFTGQGEWKSYPKGTYQFIGNHTL